MPHNTLLGDAPASSGKYLLPTIIGLVTAAIITAYSYDWLQRKHGSESQMETLVERTAQRLVSGRPNKLECEAGGEKYVLEVICDPTCTLDAQIPFYGQEITVEDTHKNGLKTYDDIITIDGELFRFTDLSTTLQEVVQEQYRHALEMTSHMSAPLPGPQSRARAITPEEKITRSINKLITGRCNQRYHFSIGGNDETR